MPECVINILHKLGLYRTSEIDNILKWATTVSCTADKVIEEAKSVKERYRAIFAMYNDINTYAHAVNVLKEHCYNQSDCTKCIFHNGECRLAHTPPCWWKL